MTDRPILFSAPMIRALLDGRKTQTRSVLKHGDFFPNTVAVSGGKVMLRNNHTGVRQDVPLKWLPGDRLWVREGHALVPASAYRMSEGVKQAINPADAYEAAIYREGWDRSGSQRWRPGSHMPRWASRLTLLVTDVRVQRLQDISEADSVAEGCFKGEATGRVFNNVTEMRLAGPEWRNARDWFADLWDSINGPEAWEANPWVAAITFDVVHGNIDQVPA